MKTFTVTDDQFDTFDFRASYFEEEGFFVVFKNSDGDWIGAVPVHSIKYITSEEDKCLEKI